MEYAISTQGVEKFFFIHFACCPRATKRSAPESSAVRHIFEQRTRAADDNFQVGDLKLVGNTPDIPPFRVLVQNTQYWPMRTTTF
jgi:hypothetical protein